MLSCAPPVRRASFVRTRCRPHAFAHPAYANARAFARAALLRCARSPHRKEWKNASGPEMGSLAFLRNRVRFARLRSFAALLLRLNCSRVVVVTLAGPRCWRFSPTPTAREVRLIRSPSPCSKERRGITVTDSRGLSPHSSNLERLVTLPRTRRLSSIFGCVGYSMASSQGGVKPSAAIARLSLLPPLSWQPSVICFALLTALSLTNAAFRQLAAHPGKTAPPFPC